MTLTWAWAENTLAMTIGIINKQAGPINGYPEAPLSLKKKIACFKIALRDIAVLKGLQEEGRVLAKRFGELGKRRHNFVHGAAWELQEGGFQSLGIRVERGDYALKDFKFNEGDATRLCAEVAALQDRMAGFMLAVIMALGG